MLDHGLFSLSTDPITVADLDVRGDRGLMEKEKIALFSSQFVPPDLVWPALDLANRLGQVDTCLVGGFQTLLEREILSVLIRGSASIIYCPARSLTRLTVPHSWRQAMDADRMALVSAAPIKLRRATRHTATNRNALVLGLANSVVIVHASPASRTFAIALAALDCGKQVYALDHPENGDLLLLGAKGLAEGEYPNAVGGSGSLTRAPRRPSLAGTVLSNN
jgi:predicted Rossmann fold nucleotide-binding protein DprA/Smf involved in DNA uptake